MSKSEEFSNKAHLIAQEMKDNNCSGGGAHIAAIEILATEFWQSASETEKAELGGAIKALAEEIASASNEPGTAKNYILSVIE